LQVWPPYETYPFHLEFTRSGHDLVAITTFVPSSSSPADVGEGGELGGLTETAVAVEVSHLDLYPAKHHVTHENRMKVVWIIPKYIFKFY